MFSNKNNSNPDDSNNANYLGYLRQFMGANDGGDLFLLDLLTSQANGLNSLSQIIGFLTNIRGTGSNALEILRNNFHNSPSLVISADTESPRGGREKRENLKLGFSNNSLTLSSLDDGRIHFSFGPQLTKLLLNEAYSLESDTELRNLNGRDATASELNLSLTDKILLVIKEPLLTLIESYEREAVLQLEKIQQRNNKILPQNTLSTAPALPAIDRSSNTQNNSNTTPSQRILPNAQRSQNLLGQTAQQNISSSQTLLPPITTRTDLSANRRRAQDLLAQLEQQINNRNHRNSRFHNTVNSQTRY